MYDYTVTEPSGLESIFANASIAVVILFVLLFLVIFALAILMIASNCVIFKKAGEKWWKGLIPPWTVSWKS